MSGFGAELNDSYWREAAAFEAGGLAEKSSRCEGAAGEGSGYLNL